MSPPRSTEPDLDELFVRLARRLLALGAHLTGDRDLAEDVLQETFLAAHRGRDGFRGEASAETWLHRIAIHAALRARRRRGRLRAVDGASSRRAGDGAAGAGESVGDRSERLERAARLHSAMDRLTEEQRVVLSLLALRDLPAKAIAEILDLPVGTVHSRGHAARARLRELLEAREAP